MIQRASHWRACTPRARRQCGAVIDRAAFPLRVRNTSRIQPTTHACNVRSATRSSCVDLSCLACSSFLSSVSLCGPAETKPRQRQPLHCHAPRNSPLALRTPVGALRCPSGFHTRDLDYKLLAVTTRGGVARLNWSFVTDTPKDTRPCGQSRKLASIHRVSRSSNCNNFVPFGQFSAKDSGR